MHTFATAREGLTLSRRAMIALVVSILVMFLAPGLGVVLAVIAAGAALIGSLMFTFGLPESPARDLAIKGFWVGLAGAAVRLWVMFYVSPWRASDSPALLLAELIGAVALAMHLGAWKEAALARSDSEAAGRCDTARIVMLAVLAVSAIVTRTTSIHDGFVPLAIGAMGLWGLIATYRAMSSVEDALREQPVTDAEAA